MGFGQKQKTKLLPKAQALVEVGYGIGNMPKSNAGLKLILCLQYKLGSPANQLSGWKRWP
jgi:hypothetical protein